MVGRDNGNDNAAWGRLVVELILLCGTAFFCLFLLTSCARPAHAQASATVTFGSPYQKPGDTGWWLPVFMQGFDGTNLQCASFSMSVTGTARPRLGHALSPGTYWGEWQGVVQAQEFPFDSLTFLVGVCKSTVGCTNEGPQGLLFTVPVDGNGTIKIAEPARLHDCDNNAPPCVFLKLPVSIPPDRPILSKRVSWGHAKGVYR